MATHACEGAPEEWRRASQTVNTAGEWWGGGLEGEQGAQGKEKGGGGEQRSAVQCATSPVARTKNTDKQPKAIKKIWSLKEYPACRQDWRLAHRMIASIARK